MIFYSILTIGYCLLFILLLIGLLLHKQTFNSVQYSVSIIICARNEDKVITNLLKSLEAIEYPADKYEVLLINDDSSDSTEKIMKDFSFKHSNWKQYDHIKKENSPKGKKGALTFGINQSKGEIILVTDADCIVQPNWIQSMVSCFDKYTGMVLGYSPVKKRKDLLSIYQRFDTLCEGTTAVASVAYNKPTHSNARNLAFRKIVFDEVGGYESVGHIDTGDDFYLSKLIKEKTNWKFNYNTNQQSFVYTDEIISIRKFLHQQLRRNSKAFDLGLPLFLMGSWVIIFHLILLFLIFSGSIIGLYLLIIKVIAEMLPALAGAKLLKEEGLIKYFPILWIVYPIIYLSSQILGSLRFYKWK